MSLVLINSISDTFTPTHSGAIGTWHWEICRCAERDGIMPLVISKSVDPAQRPYDWANTVLIPYPFGSQIRGVDRLRRLRQRISGWGHVNQHLYNARVAAVVRERNLSSATFVLHNDPELSVFMRREFPSATIVSHFYNQNPCDPRFRKAFGGGAKPDIITAVSSFTARWVESYYGLPSNSVLTLYNGVDCDRFHPSELPPVSPVVNFVGRLSRDKAPDLLLRAAARVAPKAEGLALQLLGSTFWGGGEPDAYTRELEVLAEELRNHGVPVRMPGFIDRWSLPSELRKSGIHVVPSRWDEPFALSTLEGMASGLATIACSTGGTPEAVCDSGLLFDRDDLDTLTQHLDLVVRDADARTKYARMAREKSLEFSWTRIWKRLRDITGA